MKCAVILAAFTLALAAQDTATVEGVVANRVSGLGIGTAIVNVISRNVNNRADRYQVVTDESGKFRFTGVKPGNYTVSAEKEAYLSAEGFNAPIQFHVAAGSAVNLRLEMIPPGTLRGRVIGIDKNPATNVEVALGANFNRTTTTDENGAFAFDQLAQGSYMLMARPKETKRATPQDGNRTEIVPTYYPSMVDRTLAQTILLRAGADQSGYEIQMRTAPVHRVRGAVVDASGKPAAKAVVELLSRFPGGHDGGFFTTSGGAFTITSGVPGMAPVPDDPVVTGDDGVFEFPSVIEGDWLLRAESDTVRDEIHQRDIMLYGSVDISVGGHDVDDLRIQMAGPFELNGTVELSDGAPVPGNNRFLVSLSFVGENGNRGGRLFRQADGTLRFELTPGRYRLQPTVLSSSYYVAAVRLGNSDVTGQEVEITRASLPVRIILKPAGTLRGSVEKCDGARVLLLPQKLAAGDPGWSTTCGNDGGFDFTGLPPGDYYTVAIDRFDEREGTSASYLRGLAAGATSVQVQEGSVAFVQLKVLHSQE